MLHEIVRVSALPKYRLKIEFRDGVGAVVPGATHSEQ